MFKFLHKLRPRRASQEDLLDHNTIDASIMTQILGMAVQKKEFALGEDRSRILADGVTWRRRRFRFQVPDEKTAEAFRPEALCVNEVTLDSQAKAELAPCLASDHPHLVDFAEIENAYWATTFAAGAIRMSDGVRETRLYLNLANLFYDRSLPDRRELIHRLVMLGKPGMVGFDVGDLFEQIEHRIVSQQDGKFGIARYLPAFPASRLVQASEHILAATNAGYFLNFPEEYDDDISCLHLPVGGHLVDGFLAVPPWIRRPGIVRVSSGHVKTGLFGPEDLVLRIKDMADLPLHDKNQSSDTNGLVWRHFDGTVPDLAEDAVVLSYSGSLLTAIVPSTQPLRPPFGGALVILTGQHARAALQPDLQRRLRLELRAFEEGSTPDWMVCSGPFLVRDSHPVPADRMLTPEFAGEFGPGGTSGPAPTRFPFDTGRTRAPRTAIGVLPSGGLKIVVVDGRHSGEHSCGLTLEGMSILMQTVGCETAVNLDGGGSSVMAIEGAGPSDMLRENSAYGIVNIPSDDNGRERIVPLFLTVRQI